MSNYAKLKTNLKLAIQRLKLLEKKKTELSLKSRKEIADYISINKVDRARIRVEHIIREDNYVEAMEMLEMFCDLLLARFGLIEKMKQIDPGLDEALSTIIWAAPRVSNDIQEFHTIGEILAHKYGRPYADAAKINASNNVNTKVLKRLGIEAPPKILVENYLIEIAKNFNVPYEPDQSVMLSAGQTSEELIDLREQLDSFKLNNENNNSNNNNTGGGGGGGAAMNAANFLADSPGSPNIGFDHLAKSGDGKNLIEFNGGDDLPPPLPRNLPTGMRGGPSPPPGYDINNNNNNFNNDNRFSDDSDDEYFFRPNISNKKADDVVDDQEAGPLPNKSYFSGAAADESRNKSNEPNGYFQTPPPSYNQQAHPAPHQFPIPSYKQNEEDDDIKFPSIPDYNPGHGNNNNNGGASGGQDASIDYEDLQKRFLNLKKK